MGSIASDWVYAWFGRWDTREDHASITLTSGPGQAAFAAVAAFVNQLEATAGSGVFDPHSTYPFHDPRDPTAAQSNSTWYLYAGGTDVGACARLLRPVLYDPNTDSPDDYSAYPERLSIGQPSAAVDLLNAQAAAVTAAVFGGCPERLRGMEFVYVLSWGCARASFVTPCAGSVLSSPPPRSRKPARARQPSPRRRSPPPPRPAPRSRLGPPPKG
ncbi:hypothetical protein HYH03_005912 [Edaphochlamys debaryana]|uniref:Uncharacterized protein n=1 Tax=Edaphochlamys debaryana TaxID=47281 RepID=A0A836C0Q6_9CHLO|nr:hypothetical protein HYH03_005912 [Edaphochlamys debaryana]|eukprot:KAG2495985.1 hypothetical protein HYH03_005912 [Edaphochlamys debaryana]